MVKQWKTLYGTIKVTLISNKPAYVGMCIWNSGIVKSINVLILLKLHQI